MFLTPQLVRWAVGTLRRNCHPFIGVTFLASKRIGLSVGTTTNVRLDAVTKLHLEKYHRLDPNSEFFFQPFKSTKNTFWVAANYSSSGLQAINTQTFSAALLHPPKTPQWALAEGYADKIRDRIHHLSGYGPSSLVALAVWIGKDSPWPVDANIETIVRYFRETFHITDEEITKLFDASVLPPDMEITTDGTLDLKAIAYDFAMPPDAPTETEGTLTAIRLKNIGPASELLMDFGERLTLIAGDNGLGKSFLLDAGWWALTGTWAGRPAYPFAPGGSVQPRIEYTIQNATGQQLSGESAFDWKTHTWPQSNSPPSVAALSIYARVDGSFAIADDTRARVKSSAPTSLTLFTTREVWDGKAGEIEGLIRDWVSWQLSTADSSPFTMLSRVLEHLSPEDIGPLRPTEPIRIPGDPRRIPAIKHVYGEVPILFTSAGVQRILQLAYLIIWSWQEHLLASQQTGTQPLRKMVIVVDEVEAHLHPKWQRLVLPALMSIGKLLSDQLEIQVIAATHSPMVLASVEDYFAEESDLLVHLSLVDGLINLETLDFYKYGDVSSWLTSPVFGLSHARSRNAEQAIQQAKDLQLAEDPSLDAVRQVTTWLKQTLAPDDSFWSRWIYFARQLGDDI